MQAIHRLDQPSRRRVRLDPMAVAGIEAQRAGHRVQRAAGLEVDVDPDESSVADVGLGMVGQLDLAIVPVGIE